jgi:multidrug efflux pump subunit AcrA (membrane-fusion protein)
MTKANTKRHITGWSAIALVSFFCIAALTAPQWTRLGRHRAHADETTRYTCGMHPRIVRDGPGKCPICQMALTPKTQPKSAGKRHIELPSHVVQQMGVRAAIVKRGMLKRSLRSVGELLIAENRTSVVNLKISGWVERIYVAQTGARVRRGQPLFALYSPELLAAQKEFLLALQSGSKAMARAARRRLQLWDLGAKTIDAIAKRKRARRLLTIYAPRSGYVLKKQIVAGARVQAGQDLYTIADLSRLWIHTRVYEPDAPLVKVGQQAEIELPFQLGKKLAAKVSYIYPTFDSRTRTLKVRLLLDNKSVVDKGLRPGMFVNVNLSTPKGPLLLIPREAVILTGSRQLAFVALGRGRFAPRALELGVLGDDDRQEVLSGLKEGERVVVSGQFLLDSESRLREAIGKIDASKQPSHHDHPAQRGKAKERKPYACPLHADRFYKNAGSCPICGTPLEQKARAR